MRWSGAWTCARADAAVHPAPRGSGAVHAAGRARGRLSPPHRAERRGRMADGGRRGRTRSVRAGHRTGGRVRRARSRCAFRSTCGRWSCAATKTRGDRARAGRACRVAALGGRQGVGRHRPPGGALRRDRGVLHGRAGLSRTRRLLGRRAAQTPPSPFSRTRRRAAVTLLVRNGPIDNVVTLASAGLARQPAAGRGGGAPRRGPGGPGQRRRVGDRSRPRRGSDPVT